MSDVLSRCLALTTWLVPMKSMQLLTCLKLGIYLSTGLNQGLRYYSLGFFHFIHCHAASSCKNHSVNCLFMRDGFLSSSSSFSATEQFKVRNSSALIQVSKITLRLLIFTKELNQPESKLYNNPGLSVLLSSCVFCHLKVYQKPEDLGK